MGLQVIGYILLTGTLFGLESVISRFMLGMFNPISYVNARFFIVALVLLAFYIFKINGITWPKSKILIKRSFFYGLFVDTWEVTLYIAALQYVSAGLAATINAVFPLVTVILAFFFLPNEKINWKTGLGVLLGLAGVILIIMLGETGLDVSGTNRTLGYILLMGSGLIYSSGGVYARKNMSDFDTFDSTAIRIFAAAIASTILKIIVDFDGIHVTDMSGVGLILLASVLYLIGFQLQFFILKRFGVSNVAMLNYVMPVSSSILGVILLAEVITPGMAVGMGIIIGGLVMVNSRYMKKPSV